jgi:hypothetical protein
MPGLPAGHFAYDFSARGANCAAFHCALRHKCGMELAMELKRRELVISSNNLYLPFALHKTLALGVIKQ